MTPKELESLEKDSICTIRISNDLKDQVIQSSLNKLLSAIKLNLRKEKLIVILLRDKS